MTEKEAQDLIDYETKFINNLKKDTLNNYICIGGHLNDIKNSTFYLYIRTKQNNLGYDTVYDLIKEYFGYSKSTVNNYIGVAKRFGERYSAIQEKYKDYEFSQLVEMLSLTDIELSKVLPTMTCAEIRAIKSSSKITKEKDYLPCPNTSLQIQFSEDLYNKILFWAKKRKLSMDKYVVEILEMYFTTMTDNVA